MRLLRGIALTILMVVGGIVLGTAGGALLAGEVGATLGVVAGLVMGLQLAARYHLDQSAIRAAERNTADFLSSEAARAESQRLASTALESAIVSRRTGLATLLQRQNRLSARGNSTGFGPKSGRYDGRLSADRYQHHDLEMPRGVGKRKGKPKRQRFG